MLKITAAVSTLSVIQQSVKINLNEIVQSGANNFSEIAKVAQV
jgi:hypothetical protein